MSFYYWLITAQIWLAAFAVMLDFRVAAIVAATFAVTVAAWKAYR